MPGRLPRARHIVWELSEAKMEITNKLCESGVSSLGKKISAPFNFEAFYCRLQFFGTPYYALVAAVILPDWFGEDVKGLRIRCLDTGKISGKVVDQSNSPLPKLYAPLLAPQFHVVQADLADFTSFSRDKEENACIPHDLRLEVVDAFGQAISPDFHFTWYERCGLPVPPHENIIRVAGEVSADQFLFGGSTWHARLENLVQRYLGRGTCALERILDWGVGCGLIARHFLERGHTNIFGADIDEVNIQWLRSNFGWTNALRVDFDPPMPYPDNYFDVVYSHSVFTHLSYDDHFRWLREIRRILKPGGFAFLTVATENGLYVTRYNELEKEFSQRFLTDGFIDVANLSYIGVDTGRKGYYRLVFQTRQFILENWGKLFSVQRIIPCYMEHQDLVIMKKMTWESNEVSADHTGNGMCGPQPQTNGEAPLVSSQAKTSELTKDVKKFIHKLESNPQIGSRADAFHALRSLGLDDFGEFLLTIPNPEYPKLSRLLPSMPSDEIQRSWTGNAGVALLKQTTTFVQAVSDNHNRLTGRSLVDATILDYGCGFGRISRLMYKFTEEGKVFGVDPWERAIAICKESGLLTNYFVSDYLPKSLPVGPVKFDLIYAFSVFTHLSERATLAALRVLRKYISDQGVLVITIRPIEYWYHDPLASDAQKAMLVGRHRSIGFAFQPHVREPIDGDVTYGDTSMTLDWLANNLPEWSI